MVFKDGDWKEYPSLKETATNRDAYGTWQADATVTVLTVDAEQAAAFASKGFIISGENVTITKVVFGEDSTGDQPGTNPSDNSVWTGNEAFGNWTNLEIPASYCKNLKEGDKVTFTFTVGDMVENGSVYGKMILKDGDWNQLNDLNTTFTNVDSYGAFQPDVTTSSVTLNASDAATLAKGGLIISGWNLNLTKVVFGDTSSMVDAVVVDNSNAPVEYYNLQGVRISQPAPGTIVIRRQGTDVKKIRF